MDGDKLQAILNDCPPFDEAIRRSDSISLLNLVHTIEFNLLHKLTLIDVEAAGTGRCSFVNKR